MEFGSGPVTHEITLDAVVPDGVCAAIHLKSAFGTEGHVLNTRILYGFPNDFSIKYFLIFVFMDISQKKPVVAHFREHSSFIRDKYISVVAINRAADSGSSWRLKVNETRCEWSQYFFQNDCGVLLRKQNRLEI
jgi:hypothetical protein